MEKNQRPSSSDYQRLQRQRMTPEQLAEQANARNVRRRLAYNTRTQSRQSANSTTLSDITNQNDSIVVRTAPNNNPRYTSRQNVHINIQDGGASFIPSGSSNNFAPNVVHRNNGQRRNRERVYHRSAINFHEHSEIPNVQLSPPRTCTFCQARLFHKETSTTCCMFGKTILPPIPVPEDLVSLYTDQTPTGQCFRQDIRKINHLFAFTSMGVHLDESLANALHGVYTFRAQGSIYHMIGGFLPSASHARPRFLQVYIFDTDEQVHHRLAENNTVRPDIIEKVRSILHRVNPFVHNLRSLAQREDIHNCALRIHEQPLDRPQYCLPTASQVAAVIVGGDEVANLNPRDILVQSTSGQLLNVMDTAGYYDPLQYPLLFPYGSYGWSIHSVDNSGRTIPCRAFYAYIFQIRLNVISIILLAGRLLQQFIVDMFVKIEANKLRWIRDNQDTLRVELYEGLHDCFDAGELNPANIGKKTILPSSFVGSPRDMNQRYQDAMAIVQHYGKPDIFLTITCNPSWREIVEELLPGQIAQDRPDLITRIFHAKFEEFKSDVVDKSALGKVTAYVYVVEFQKRGLPHVHMLLILDENDKPRSPDDYDKFVKAEIPDREEEPRLYDVVLKHMIHNPCTGRRDSSCMENGVCKRKFPKPFSATTVQGDNSYPIFRRRVDRCAVPLHENDTTFVDNSWVVPYNPWLLLKYDCHINIEICSSIKCVKYLYKYVCKGVDRVSMEVRAGSEHNEIQQFVDARWICAPEALWRIYQFPLTRMCPSVERLQLHLQNKQQIRFNTNHSIEDILQMPENSRTMLTEFFKMNVSDPEAREYLYREFPQHYRWISSSKTWQKRISNQRVIGRIYTASPMEGERFFLRLVLDHVRGPKSFEHLRTVDGVVYQSFRETAEKLGIMENDASIRNCLHEASNSKMPSSLRRLFITILVYCQPTGVRALWDEFFYFMSEDFTFSNPPHMEFVRDSVLLDIDRMLKQLGKTISNFDLPVISLQLDGNVELARAIHDEISAPISPEDVHCVEHLNNDQRHAFDVIMNAIDGNNGQIFFLDGPGGTGKTFLYRAILATIKLRGEFALAVASSGIAATLLHRGKTSHKTLGIPVRVTASSTWKFSKQDVEAQLVKHAAIIIWDEATMTHRHAYEAVDRGLRDLMGVDIPFGGKVFLFGGDFRQILPVVPKGTKAQTIDACLVKSTLWRHVQVLHLTQNMRSRDDEEFAAFLLRVGDGCQPMVDEDMIQLPSSLCVQNADQNSIENLLHQIFTNIVDHVGDVRYMVERAIITPTNGEVDMLNEKILKEFTGDEKLYYSFDFVSEDHQNLYQQEFLNSLSFGGLPPHILRLNIGSPIMLLRNIDTSSGLCNGTRLICCQLMDHVIEAEILTGHCKGTRVFIPRIPMKTADDVKLPFEMIRKQFPVKLCFALTINKSQGQTIHHVGIYLPQHVFSHGQLYVALSRGTSQQTTKILVSKGDIRGRNGVFTKNIVYKEVLLPHYV